MKKTVSLFVIILLAVGLVSAVLPQGPARSAASAEGLGQAQTTPTPGSAGTAVSKATATPALQGILSAPPTDVASFRMFGLSEKALYGPYDSFRVRFSPPATWKLENGAELVLVITAFVVREDNAGTPLYTGGLIAGALDVTFNNKLIGSLVLTSGQNVIYRVPIPADALASARADGRQELFLFLDAGVDCKFENRRTSVVIEPDSAFILPHTLVSPPVDLASLPRPFYQSGAFLIDPALIVVPDQPSAGELQAALTAAASFGGISGKKLPVSLVKESGLTQDARKASNLVFVGKAASLPSLSAVVLPAPASEAGFSAPGVQASDGVVQMAISPWDPSKVILALGGGDDAGVIKAAQAFSSASFQTANRPDLALVAEVRPAEPVTSVPADRSFADLGYPAQTVSGIGGNELFYTFYVPLGQVAYQDAYVEIVHSHSDLINDSRSGVVVTLNGQPIGSIRLDENNTYLGRKRISIPASLLVPGDNTISIQAELLALDNCATFNGNNLWLTVFSESSLHIPLEPAKVILSALKDLSAYPYPLLSSPTLANLSFILPQDSLVAWQEAVRIAYDLGDRANGALYEPAAAYANQVPEDLLKNRDLMLVGVPVQLPLLAKLNQYLPVPFAEGTNLTKDTGGRVVYRLPADASVGYLELLPSSWDPAHTILAVLASKLETLGSAVDALTLPALRSQLCGNFAVIQGSQVVCRDSGLVPAAASLPGNPTAVSQAAGAPTLTPIAGLLSGELETAPPPGKVGWIMPLIVILVLLMAAVAGVAFYTSRRVRPGAR